IPLEATSRSRSRSRPPPDTSGKARRLPWRAGRCDPPPGRCSSLDPRHVLRLLQVALLGLQGLQPELRGSWALVLGPRVALRVVVSTAEQPPVNARHDVPPHCSTAEALHVERYAELGTAKA